MQRRCRGRGEEVVQRSAEVHVQMCTGVGAVKTCRGAEVQRCRDAEMQRCSGAVVQSEVQRCRIAEVRQRCRGVEVLRC
jgi:hypothetical protein